MAIRPHISDDETQIVRFAFSPGRNLVISDLKRVRQQSPQYGNITRLNPVSVAFKRSIIITGNR